MVASDDDVQSFAYLRNTVRARTACGPLRYSQVPDETLLRQKALAVVENGKLPKRRPDRTWGGPGVGASCTICELPIPEDQMEFEIEFAHNGDSPGLDKFHVHIRCYAAWEFERRHAG